MDRTQFTPEELSFIDFLRRPAKLNRHSAKRLITDLEESIADKKQQIASTRDRLKKNLLYAQIDGRKSQITHASTFIN